MKASSLVLSAISLASFVAPIGCGGMAVQSYINDAKTSSTLPQELEPPPCTHGEDGKNAIIKAFRESGSKPPGVLPLATFVSLSCYRTKQVQAATGAVKNEEVFKANVPVDKELLDTMIAAWKATPDEKTRDEMNKQFLFMDHVLAFQLYAAIQDSDKPLTPTNFHPKGAFFPIEGASKDETETVRKAWCQYVAPVSFKRFFDDSLRAKDNTFLERDTAMAGLIGNQCAETDQMLSELIKRVDKNAKEQEDQWHAKEKLDRGAFISTSTVTLHKDAEGYPLISHIGKDIAAQGSADPQRTKHYLEVLAKAGHSCAFGADIKGGLDGAISSTPELKDSIGTFVTTYNDSLRKACGDFH